MDHTPQSYIGKLPAELLEKILEFVIESCSYNSQAQICKVNRHFNSIATPLIYHYPKNIHCYQRDQLIRRIKLLQRTFVESPALIHHCRTISIHIHDGEWEENRFSADSFELIRNFLLILTKLTDFRIQGGFDTYHQETWSLISAVLSTFPLLQSLSLGRYAFGLKVSDLIHYLWAVPTLQTLYIRGAIHLGGHSADDITLQRLTGTITGLYLDGYIGDFENISQLIHWPRSLHHFQITKFRKSGRRLDLAMLGTTLMIQKESLETLRISYLNRIEEKYEWLVDAMINLTQFPKLRRLTLSRWSFRWKGLEFCESVGRKILAPNLESFTWDFTVDEQWRQYWDDLGPNEANWILNLGILAADINSPLSSIYIKFNVEYVVATKDSIYTWDLLDRVADDLATRNIQLKYSRPLVSRDTWRLLKRYNEYKLFDDGSKTTFFKLDCVYGHVEYNWDNWIEEQKEVYEKDSDDQDDEIQGRGGRRRRRPLKTVKAIERNIKRKDTKRYNTKHTRMELLDSSYDIYE